MVFVTGEAGIGKTTVVDVFVARLSAKSNVWIGRGQCIEHYGQGEAYLPVLEALGRLCRESDGRHLIDLLAQHAPTWLVQMPALLSTTDLEALQRRTQGATRERMLRELAEAVEVLSAERPLVLVLEDLHWSDVSTLDLLAFIARRRESARLLIIGAYRPVEAIVNNHPLKAIKQELQLHGQCVELPLSFLTEAHVAKYLARRTETEIETERKQDRVFTATRGSKEATGVPQLARLIHQRTEGNPLFMVNLVDYLISQGVLARIEGQWRLQGEIAAVARWVPESLQQMIEKQIERLSPQDRRMLEAASVAGAEFSAAAVAAGAGIAVEAVEEQCGELVRHEQFLRARGTAEWPDGTVAARYSFQHALYREVLYDRLTARRRQRWHQQIGERVEQAYGERTREIAAELAVHFEQGRDYHKAIQYLRRAGVRAAQRTAYVEAVAHLTKGLELLKTLPDTPERARQELALQHALSGPLMVIKGFGVPEVEKVLTRAYELCQQVGETPQLFPALWRLLVFYFNQGEHRTTHELAEQMMGVAQSVQDPYLLSYAHLALGWTSNMFGELTAMRTHAEQVIVMYDPQQHPRSPFFMDDPRVSGLSLAAWALWYLGYPDQALQRSQEAQDVAKGLAHPVIRISVLVWAAMFHLTLRREGPRAGELAEAGVALATEQGFPYGVAYGTVARGGALAAQGQVEEGIAQMQQSLAALRAIGTVQGQPRQLAVLAEAYGRAGQVEEGLAVLTEALALVDKTGERYYEAELCRLKGELTLQQFHVQGSKFKVENSLGSGV
jgi:predicted ATPase